MRKTRKRIISYIVAMMMIMPFIPVMEMAALNGTASYQPAESNIAGKYWVTATADSGTADNAVDGDLNTAWSPVGNGAHQLAVDLGGAYDAVYKTEIVFVSANNTNQYTLEGSRDGTEWTTLSDRSANSRLSGGFTDVFSFPGLRYLRVNVTGTVTQVRELRIINFLREDMDNGSDTSGFTTNTTYYNANNNPPAPDGIRGGVMNEDSVSTGNNFFGLTKDMGWDTIRLRIWNDPKHESDNSWWRDRNHNIVGFFPAYNTGNSNCSVDRTKTVARYINGAGQRLAIDFHYADSWSDPQNQPKPYAWANIPWDDPTMPVQVPDPNVAPDLFDKDNPAHYVAASKGLVTTVYDFTYDTIKQLIDQNTAPSVVALGNEITNGMLWGSEYELTNPYADFHDYFARFIRGRGEGDLDKDLVGSDPRGAAPKGGGVKWIRYEQALEALEASGGDQNSEAYHEYEALYTEFLESIKNLSVLIDAGQRAIDKLNADYELNIETELHFAFNVFEQPITPPNSPKVQMDPDAVYQKVLTLIGGIADNLGGMSGMTDRIGISYYPDWHGTYGIVQRNIVELSKLLPGVKFNIAECSPSSSGTVRNTGNDWMSNPNVVRNPLNDDPALPDTFTYSTQWQGEDTINIMQLINDVPNNVGMGVWPWNGQSVYFTGGQPRASFLAFSQAFATGVVESAVYVTTEKGVAPVLPATVKELKIDGKTVSDVTVTWEAINPESYANAGVFTIKGTAAAAGNMTEVTATITVSSFDAAIPTPSGATRDTNRIVLRVSHSWLSAANYPRWISDYEGEDALSLWYTDDGSDPYQYNPNAQRIRINPAVTGAGALSTPSAYILDYKGGTTYKFVAYNGDQYGSIYSYTTPMHEPRLTIDNNIDPARTNNVLRLTSGLYKESDVADGIRLFTDAAGGRIYYQTAPCVWNPAISQFGVSDVDALTAAELQANGTVYNADAPISADGVDETNAIAIRATAVKDGVAASAAVTYKIRVTEDDQFITLKADKDGNMLVDLDAFIAQLTVEEKLMLLGGVGGDPIWLQNGYNYPIESNNDGILRTGGPAGGTPALPRFNIPSLVLADGPAGVRMWKNATIWMAPAGIGATWNAGLAEQVGARYAEEAKHYAVDIVLGPGINNQRNPLSGRNFEYYSEDPYILGYTAASQVKGMQDGGVAATLKHFAANDYESGRSNSAYATERSLREIYLRAFEIAVEKSQPWAVMTGYNGINSIATARNPWLTTNVLRDEWGFGGFVMTDWGGDAQTASLEAQTDMSQSSARTLNTYLNWVNHETNGARNLGYLNRSVKNVLGTLVKTFAFQGEYGVLQPDGTYADGTKVDGTPTVGLTNEDIGSRHLAFGSSDVQKDSRVVNKQVADEAIVLMKNKNDVLPLQGNEKVALVTSRKAWQEYFNLRWYGDSASVGDVVLQGTGSAQVRFNNSTEDYAMTLVEALDDRGFDVVDWQIDFGALGNNNQAFLDAFDDNPPSQGGKKYVFSEEQAKAATAELAAYNAANAVPLETARANAKAAAETAAAAADVGIFVLTRISGEGNDVTSALFNIEAKELVVYEEYEKAFHAAGKPLIVLLNVGGTTNTTAYRGGTVTAGAVTATTQGADAILDIWNPGSAGTEAIADILKGTVNPSGKLAQTFPVNFNDSPSVHMFAEHNENYPNARYPGNGYNNAAYYADGVYVGYRFYESRPENYETMVAYPFGYGLSYTKFAFSDLKLDKNIFDKSNQNDAITATVTVKNVGDVPGKEVVQLYLGASTWQEEGRPKNELRAYGKTSLLAPGESETVTLTIHYDDLVYFDDNNPEGLIPTNYSANNPPVYGQGDGWTVADDTVFTVTVRANAENADKPNAPIAGLTDRFTYGEASGLVSGAAAIDSLGDGSVNASISLVNESDAIANALLVYAVYDAAGRMVQNAVNPVSADAQTNQTLNFTIGDIPEGGSVKAFVWRMPDESFADAYVPVCEAVVYNN